MSKRKTIAEVKAKAREEGFEMALEVVRREWRKKTRASLSGPTDGEEIREVLDKLQHLHGLLSDDVNELYMPRNGVAFIRISKRCVVKAGHPHAGSRGFFLDTGEQGPVKVWFLGQRHQIDSAVIFRCDLELSEET